MQQWIQLLPLVILFASFYFFLIRPQNKQRKERMAMLSALKKGDKVVTIGGLHGTIVDLNEEKVTLKVSDNVRLVFDRSAINAVINAEASAAKTEEKEEKKDEKKAEPNEA
jgi:preprotein translocase subunit YajC